MEIKSWHFKKNWGLNLINLSEFPQTRMVENLDLTDLFSYIWAKFHWNTAKVVTVWIMILQKEIHYIY